MSLPSGLTLVVSRPLTPSGINQKYNVIEVNDANPSDGCGSTGTRGYSSWPPLVGGGSPK